MDPAKWTPSLNQRDELDRAMKTAGVLREWAALKRQGIIDDAEFQAMKARLLGRPPPAVEQVSDDEEKIGWSVNNDDEDAQRWARETWPLLRRGLFCSPSSNGCCARRPSRNDQRTARAS